MPLAPLFGVSQKGKSFTATAQKHTGLYAEIVPDRDKSSLVFYNTPGLTLDYSYGDTPVRGSIATDDLKYEVHRGTLWSVNNAGIRTALGALATTTGKVRMSFNGRQIVIADGTRAYSYTINQTAQPIATITNAVTVATLTTTLAHGRSTGDTVIVSGATPAAYNGTFVITVTGANTFNYTMLSNPGGNATVVGSYTVSSSFSVITSGLFQNPIDVTYADQYSIFAFDNGRWQISSPNDATTVDALDFANAESNPDGLLRVIADHGEVVLLGPQTVEFWGNTGAQDFPYANQRGATLEFGLVAPSSLVKYNDSLAGLFKSTMGQSQVMMMKGHALAPISTPELDYIINGYATIADASALSYMVGGHPFYQINFPSAGKAWLFDSQSNLWSPIESGLTGGRSRAEIRTDYLNKTRVTDFENGNVYTLSPDVYTDNGSPIPREIISRHFFSDAKRVRVDVLQIEFESGVGLITGQGQDPQVMMQISKDGGHTYGNDIWVSAGKIGEYKYRVIWRRLGVGRDWVFKFRVTDPIKIVITNAYMDYSVLK